MGARAIASPAIFAAAILALSVTAGHASLTGSTLETIVVVPPPDAQLPIETQWKNEDGVTLTLGEAMNNRAAVVIFADFTCNTLCGPMVALAADALGQSGLLAGRDYRLIVLGIDPKDGAAEAS